MFFIFPHVYFRYMEDDDDILQGLPPPRLFCDICDVFDQHDTDDCPLQAGSDSPPPSTHHGVRAPGGSDRPYCVNCESRSTLPLCVQLCVYVHCIYALGLGVLNLYVHLYRGLWIDSCCMPVLNLY